MDTLKRVLVSLSTMAALTGCAGSGTLGPPADAGTTALRTSPVESALGLGPGEEAAAEQLIFELRSACAAGDADSFSFAPQLVVRQQTGFGHADAHAAFHAELQGSGTAVPTDLVDASEFCSHPSVSSDTSRFQDLAAAVHDVTAEQRDSNMAQLEEEWSQCMGGRGHEYSSLDDMYGYFETEAQAALTAIVESERSTGVPIELLESQAREVAIAADHVACGGSVQAAGPLASELQAEDEAVIDFLSAEPEVLQEAVRELEAARSAVPGPLSVDYQPEWSDWRQQRQ